MMDADGEFLSIAQVPSAPEPATNISDLFIGDIVYFEVVHDMPAALKQLGVSQVVTDRAVIAVSWLSPVAVYQGAVTYVSIEAAKVSLETSGGPPASGGLGKQFKKVASHYLLPAGLWPRGVWNSLMLYKVGDLVYYFDHDDMRLKVPDPSEGFLRTSNVLGDLLNHGELRVEAGSDPVAESFLKITDEHNLTQSKGISSLEMDKVWTLTDLGKSKLRVARSLANPQKALPDKSPDGEPHEKWSLLSLLLRLEEEGWTAEAFQPGKAPAPYVEGQPKVWCCRLPATPPSELYLLALLKAPIHKSPVPHTLTKSGYVKILHGEAPKPRARVSRITVEGHIPPDVIERAPKRRRVAARRFEGDVVVGAAIVGEPDVSANEILGRSATDSEGVVSDHSSMDALEADAAEEDARYFDASDVQGTSAPASEGDDPEPEAEAADPNCCSEDDKEDAADVEEGQAPQTAASRRSNSNTSSKRSKSSSSSSSSTSTSSSSTSKKSGSSKRSREGELHGNIAEGDVPAAQAGAAENKREMRGQPWGCFRITPKDAKDKTNPAWQVACFHPSHCTASDKTKCTRSRSYKDPAGEERAMRVVKWWALQANSTPSKAEHQRLKDPTAADLPSMAELDESILAFTFAE